MNEVFSTPSYRRMIERQQAELEKMHNNDIDLFVRMLAERNQEPMEVKTTVSIGVKPELIRKQEQERERIHQKHVADSHDQGFLGGMLFSAMLVLMVLSVFWA